MFKKICKYILGIKEDYYRVEFNYDLGSAYQYLYADKIPCKIKFGRKHNDKFQEDIIETNCSYNNIYNLMFLLKRGEELNKIEEIIKVKFKYNGN
jgi:hypothetical protein